MGTVTELVAADIGGTHARFAIAAVADGRVVRLGESTTLRTADYDGLDMAWQQVRWNAAGTLPRAAALAVAAPLGPGPMRLTNSEWVIRPETLDAQLGLDRHLLINDFGAVGHAVQHGAPTDFTPICGPRHLLPDDGVITICGPGTGLGVAQLIRGPKGYRVVETEGGHVGFAPNDDYEDRLVATLRERHGRVSGERVCAGPAILAHYALLAREAGWSVFEASERIVWEMGLGEPRPDDQASAAVERFCAALGSVAGDLALAHGAKAVVIAGGLGRRLRTVLPRSRFSERFTDKGRFAELMECTPVSLITMPEPGLFGAAAAFAQQL